MRVVLSVLAVGGWLFVSGAIVFAGILPGWFSVHFGAIARDPKALPVWAIAIEKVLQACGLVLLLCVTTAPVWMLVPIPLLLVSATYLFSTYANYKVPGKPVVVIAAIDAVRLTAPLFIGALILQR